MTRFWPLALLPGLLAPLNRPDSPPRRPEPATPAGPASSYPFGVGERFEYVAKFGVLNVGTGSISVAGLDTVRGAETYVFQFHLEGGALMFTINDTLRSWVGTRDMVSRRFRSDLRERNFERSTVFEILPDSGYFRENDQPEEKPTVAEPLDDAAFFYFVRTTALEVGQTYEFYRYFKKDKNPVRIRVLGREDFELPDGSKVKTLVLHPLVDDNGNGMFSRKADARLWLTDDARRIPVQIRSKFVFGTITLRITGITLANGARTTPQ